MPLKGMNGSSHLPPSTDLAEWFALTNDNRLVAGSSPALSIYGEVAQLVEQLNAQIKHLSDLQ